MSERCSKLAERCLEDRSLCLAAERPSVCRGAMDIGRIVCYCSG